MVDIDSEMIDRTHKRQREYDYAQESHRQIKDKLPTQ